LKVYKVSSSSFYLIFDIIYFMKKMILIIISIIFAIIIAIIFMRIISVIFFYEQLLLKGSDLFITLAFYSIVPIGILTGYIFLRVIKLFLIN